MAAPSACRAALASVGAAGARGLGRRFRCCAGWAPLDARGGAPSSSSSRWCASAALPRAPAGGDGLYGGAPPVDVHDLVREEAPPAALQAVLGAWWRAAAEAPVVRAELEGNYEVPSFFLRHERLFQQFAAYVGERPELAAELRPLCLAPLPGSLSAAGARPEDVEEIARPFLEAVRAFVEEVYGRQLATFRRARRLADLQHPHRWFPAARRMRRRWLVHLGPTNSGKTHAATGRLLAAASGVYMSPLRLLAAEMYERMRRAGLRCALLTGQERLGPEDATHLACTVEMAPLSRAVAVAIVDEAQLVVDLARGAAWTRALLGVQAAELHVCGAAEPPGLLELLQQLALDCGDTVAASAARQRLVPLLPEERPLLRGLADISPGDCLVCFTRRDIMLAKAELENLGHSLAVVYGGLPPSVRREQAALFNDPSSGHDVLVASDAIGMGLNLDIRRVVFRTLRKFDGETTRRLHPSELRQIAGRAGRFGGRFSDRGLVACLSPEDHAYVVETLAPAGGAALPEAGCRAAIFPTAAQLEAFSDALEGEVASRLLPFADLVERFLSMATVSPTYAVARADNVLEAARSLSEVRLPAGEKFVFCQAPVSLRDVAASAAVQDFARRYANSGAVAFPEIEVGEPPVVVTPRYVFELESLYRVCDVYCWLAGRFPDAFADAPIAEVARRRVAERIAQSLRRPLALGEAAEEGLGSGEAFFDLDGGMDD